MDIKVLGTGCATCSKLYATVEQAIAQTGVDATLSKVEDIDAIMRHGVMTTPALVIDGKVVAAGRVPDVAQVSSWLTTAEAEAR
jgi:small redox-active disulfide protein 2